MTQKIGQNGYPGGRRTHKTWRIEEPSEAISDAVAELSAVSATLGQARRPRAAASLAGDAAVAVSQVRADNRTRAMLHEHVSCSRTRTARIPRRYKVCRYAPLSMASRLYLAASSCPDGWVPAFAGMTHVGLVARDAAVGSRCLLSPDKAKNWRKEVEPVRKHAPHPSLQAQRSHPCLHEIISRRVRATGRVVTISMSLGVSARGVAQSEGKRRRRPGLLRCARNDGCG